MAQKQPIPEIRAAAFAAAREKCALSVEELAHLACLSKKQIHQLENGGRDAFYTPAIKYIAAKKVAQLIQLDEKAAFDFGPQAELPLASATDVGLSESAIEKAPEQALSQEITRPTEVAKSVIENPIHQAETKLAVTAIEGDSPQAAAHQTRANPKSSGKKWLWLLPAGAVALLLVQFQPLMQAQLDVVMSKDKSPEVLVAPLAPPAGSTTPSASTAEAPAAPTVVAPSPPATTAALPVVTAQSACPPSDSAMESYRPPGANKPGNIVFIRVGNAQVVCVIDADGVVQSKAMEPSFGISFYGKPPFKLLSSGELGSAEIFFQGYRMRPSAPDMRAMLLVQAD
jgi:cytoskeleton protein RodZ